MTRRTVNVVCTKAPRRVGCVPAILTPGGQGWRGRNYVSPLPVWRCSYCGARVKVVA